MILIVTIWTDLLYHTLGLIWKQKFSYSRQKPFSLDIYCDAREIMIHVADAVIGCE